MAKFINALGEEYVPKNWLTYDDVLLLPQFSKIKSRNSGEIDLSTRIGNRSLLNIPVIAAPMTCVCDSKMAQLLDSYEAMGIVHRFWPDDKFDQYEIHFNMASNLSHNIGLAVGKNNIDWVLNSKYDNVTYCVDFAHGDLEDCLLMIEQIRGVFPDSDIISGSICTPDAAERSLDAGANILRVGVGCGSVCTTRIKTGHGSSQLSALMAIRKRVGNEVSIISDGSIRNSGDIIKSLAAGANAVMLGRLLAGTVESPAPAFYLEADDKGSAYKEYYGMASQSHMDNIGKKGVTAEGEKTRVKIAGTVKQVLDDLMGGVRSGMSYSGVTTIEQLQDKAQFTEISYHSYIEGTPHGVNK